MGRLKKGYSYYAVAENLGHCVIITREVKNVPINLGDYQAECLRWCLVSSCYLQQNAKGERKSLRKNN